jgi:predicted MFS family arabinose efflux permease
LTALRPTSTTHGTGQLVPLVLATLASQALLVVLAPTIDAIANDFRASIGAVAQARSISAAVAVVCAAMIMHHAGAAHISRLMRIGGVLALLACVTVATTPTLTIFLGAHVLVGASLALLLSAGFAGTAGFPRARRGWALGYVAAGNALAWIVINPAVAALTQAASWRLAQLVPASAALAVILAARGVAPHASGVAGPSVTALISQPSARRWITVELVAFGAWTALLTFIGPFFIDRIGVRTTTAGWLMAGGAATYLAASISTRWLLTLISRRHLATLSTMMMAALLPLLLGKPHSPPFALAIFCLIAAAAGARTPASAAIGLAQLPHHPGTTMSARTAANQGGYLLGAVVGAAVLPRAGYGGLALVLAVALTVSALLLKRLDDEPEPSASRPEPQAPEQTW